MGCATPACEIEITAANPAIKPENAMIVIVSFCRFKPDKREASALPPIAYTERPHRVRPLDRASGDLGQAGQFIPILRPRPSPRVQGAKGQNEVSRAPAQGASSRLGRCSSDSGPHDQSLVTTVSFPPIRKLRLAYSRLIRPKVLSPIPQRFGL